MKTFSYLKNLLGIVPNKSRNTVESSSKPEIAENGNSNSNENNEGSPGRNLIKTKSQKENGNDNSHENTEISHVISTKNQTENRSTNSNDIWSLNQSSRNRLNTPETKRNKQTENHETPRSNLRRRLSGNKMGDFEVDGDDNKKEKLKEKNNDANYRSTPTSKRYVHAKNLDYQVQKDIQMANELALLRRCQAAWSKGDDIPLILDCEDKLTHLNPKIMVHKSYKKKFEEDKEVVMLRKQLKEAEILKASSISSEDYRILRQQLSSAFQPKLVS